jgi:hypothetical protein
MPFVFQAVTKVSYHCKRACVCAMCNFLLVDPCKKKFACARKVRSPFEVGVSRHLCCRFKWLLLSKLSLIRSRSPRPGEQPLVDRIMNK